jgi:hypothetical protein
MVSIFLMVSFLAAVLLGVGVAAYQFAVSQRRKKDIDFSLTRTWLFAITCGVVMFLAALAAGDVKSLELTDYFLFATAFGFLAEAVVSLVHQHRDKIVRFAIIIPIVFGILFGVWGAALPA